MRCLGSQIDGLWVGLQSVDDALLKWCWEVERDEWLIGKLATVLDVRGEERVCGVEI